MEFLLQVNWIALAVLAIVFLLFALLKFLSEKINWTFVILLSLVFGAVVGIVFGSENNSYLVWVDLLGDIYINLITALVAPVILVSIVSGFISLNDKDKMKKIGLKSVVWLLISSAAAIILSLFFGLIVGLGKNAGSVFAGIGSVSDGTVSAYEGLKKSFSDVVLGLFPSNVVGDLSSNNVVAIIIIAIALAVAYVSVAHSEGEEKVITFKKFVESFKKIIYKILEFVIDLTPYAVLCLIAGSASKIFTNADAILQLLLLVGMIYLVCLVHTYGFNALVLRFAAKVSPLKFYKKIFQAQATAFTTQSSVGTLPITISNLKDNVGVDEEVANFTAPLGTTIGMPGCTCVWPILLAIFYVNAAGLNWGVGDYLLLAALTLVLSLGSAGVPGIAVVSSIAVFGAVNLPIAAVVLLMPINTISDMIRTMDNVSAAAVSATVVARRTNLLNDEVFGVEVKKQKRIKVAESSAEGGLSDEKNIQHS
jgi:hypothetical protein